MDAKGQHSRGHLAVLDGWRALSILAVMAGHWLPLGPSAWQMNGAVAASGMALFFCLSGFLITYFLLEDSRIWPFVVKRVSRILPLAWVAMIILAIAGGVDWATLGANLLFVSNLPPDNLMTGGHHLWSLCVEMQFYVLVAILVGTAGRRSLYLLPLLCLAVTGMRISNQEIISIVTWHRLDEILSGACVALFWHHRRGQEATAPAWLGWLPILAFVLLVAAANPHTGAFGYLRPYLAALAVGGSLFAFPPMFAALFTSSPARYIARISYALYVVHGVLGATWLGGEEASKIKRYLLRIPLTAATFALAHLSTRYYESFFSRAARTYLGHRDARAFKEKRPI